MSSKKHHFTYVFGAFIVGACFILAAPVGAENATTIDLSTQPHLKSWSNVIPNAAKRFVVLADFNNEAVLDRETGLVWERSPDGSPRTWFDAVRGCWLISVGGRMGWHLPTIEELASLLDPALATSGLALPAGNPFQNVQPSTYWSTTTDVRVPFSQHKRGKSASTVAPLVISLETLARTAPIFAGVYVVAHMRTSIED